MEKTYTFPGMVLMMEKLNEFSNGQLEMMENLKKTFTDFNPMQSFFPEGETGFPFGGAISEQMDMFEKGMKQMTEVAEMLMPSLSKTGDKPYNPFMENFPDLQANILKKIFEIPPVGITRKHQEKINAALDKMSVYNTAAMEFLYCTMVPLEEATRLTLKEMLKQYDTVKTPEDAQKFYKKWIELMETEYQSMFKTDHYKDVLAKIFNSMGECRAAGRELILDFMHLLGVPFGREIDELCKEVFDLKKKIKEMDSQLKETAKKKA